MYASGMPSSSSESQRGVEICVEALTEWKIQEIGYDGIEKYMKPLEFKDVVTKNAANVNWREIIGKEASLDVKRGMPSADDNDDEENADRTVSKVEPAAGPWANVAKNIHMTLQELNVLLDTLHILKSHYMSPIAIVPETAALDDPKTNDRIIASKGFQFCTRKKALSEALKIISDAKERREKTTCLNGANKNLFFTELRKMRENWRVRKVNNAVFGDLGYRIFKLLCSGLKFSFERCFLKIIDKRKANMLALDGQKFNNLELFDVTRRTVDEHDFYLSGDSSKSACDYLGPIQVQIPRNLMQRTSLCVSVQKDSEENGLDLFKNREFSFGDTSSTNIHWEKALSWAQEALICRDIYEQLLRDCVASKRICMPAQYCLVVALFDDIILKVDQKFYPFQGDIPEEGDPYLNKLLRELFVLDQSKKSLRNQQFISLPQTVLPENLDLRGPQALSAEEISSRKVKSSSLLSRLIDMSSHYILIKKVIQSLKRHIVKYSDPQIQFKFVRSTNVFSIISVVLINRCFENIGKYSLQVRIFADKVVIVTKESQQIHCRRDMRLFRDALLLLTSNFLLNSVALMSKTYAWQILHANNNAFNEDGNPAPTFYACNQNATKLLFIQFPADGNRPLIFLKQKNDPNEPIRADSGDPFSKLNYLNLPGSSFMRKTDFILATFRN